MPTQQKKSFKILNIICWEMNINILWHIKDFSVTPSFKTIPLYMCALLI